MQQTEKICEALRMLMIGEGGERSFRETTEASYMRACRSSGCRRWARMDRSRWIRARRLAKCRRDARLPAAFFPPHPRPKELHPVTAIEFLRRPGASDWRASDEASLENSPRSASNYSALRCHVAPACRPHFTLACARGWRRSRASVSSPVERAVASRAARGSRLVAFSSPPRRPRWVRPPLGAACAGSSSTWTAR